MPHKTCPQCGQPAVLEITQCRRCGFVFEPSLASGAPPRYSSAPPSVEIPLAQRQAQQRNSVARPLTLLLALGLGVLLLALVGNVVKQAVLERTAFPAGSRRGSSPLAASPADSASSPGKLSLFVESESPQEMPILTFNCYADTTMSLTLRDRYGHVYRASSRLAESAKMQVPPGEYSVSIDSDNPHIRPNWGDATFRKFKAYHADFIVGHSDERVHLGD